MRETATVKLNVMTWSSSGLWVFLAKYSQILIGYFEVYKTIMTFVTIGWEPMPSFSHLV